MDYSIARDALLHICGGKAYDWLDNMDSEEDVKRVRRIILEDYSFNSFDLQGIRQLAVVLKYLGGYVLHLEERDMAEQSAHESQQEGGE